MIRNRNNINSFTPARGLMLLALILMAVSTAFAQTTPKIVIGGDIYGGGKEGAVGTSKATNPTGDKDNIILVDGAIENGNTTSITINDGTIRTVFGGGENGRTFGSTSVTVQGTNTQIGGTVNGIDWNGSIHGGVFGAGDGSSAYVFGHSSVLISGGTVVQNVYGGGNQADLMGTTSVTLRGGDIESAVFGGARLANVYGYSYVDIDGANATTNLNISSVYGGNDIGGNIVPGGWAWTLRDRLTLPANLDRLNDNGIDNTWNAFVHSSKANEGHAINIDQLFGGGNGDYTYTQNGSLMNMSELTERTWNESSSQWEFTPHTFTVSSTPEVSKVYLELDGGIFGSVYGGGNNATVTTSVDICLDNTTTVATGNYQFDRVFGGNNKAAMAIQPTWHLRQAIINNLYSGGNAGNMTYQDGLLLAITGNDLTINNVYGGCRMADVVPDGNNVGEKTFVIDGTEYTFPAGHSARVLITAGNINTVYGGNDISGNVVGGNAVDIRSSIKGDVYGGGNGSYAYTDNANLKDNATYGDYYYSTEGFTNTAAALNAHRPNAEQAWIHVSGTEAKPTVIGGSLYCGGNSATLDISESDANAGSKSAQLKIGSYVIAQNVFLGSNGENMVKDDILALYHNGKVGDYTFNSMTMNNATFAEYIKGVSVGIRPKVSFDTDYIDESTQIGSFFLGGNLGSITASGTFNVEFAKKLVIYEKLVAGCNNANYSNDTYSIDYEGGVTTATTNGTPKINIELNNIVLKPGKLENSQVVFNTTGAGDAKRLIGGNIFGGCYSTGYINGDVVINLNADAVYDDHLFGSSNSGVTRSNQTNDLFSTALSVFGGGYGLDAEIRGNTTVNISGQGDILKVFGGGLQGPVNGNTTISITGGNADRIYGGGFEGLVAGNTAVYLDGGTVINSFGGACNAAITGYAQTFIGTAKKSLTTVSGSVYGGNDFGGKIGGSGDFTSRLRDGVSAMAYNSGAGVKSASAYVEYLQGTIEGSIYGGSCGNYDYSDATYSSHITDADHKLPELESAFVYFRGNTNTSNKIAKIFGACEGAQGKADDNNTQDKMQMRSYVLVDAEKSNLFASTEVFGSGANSGLGMALSQAESRTRLNEVSAVVDLVQGQIGTAYGASYNEGVTRSTVVNVPQGSTAVVTNIYGGGYGSSLTAPCDAIESHVNWNSSDARVKYIYGGNNNARRTLYTFVNINAQAWWNKESAWLTTAYGAGNGANTWAQYTEVNMNSGALLYEVYGGGYNGKVLNTQSLAKWKELEEAESRTIYTVIGSGYTDNGLEDELVRTNGLGTKCNSNVYINKGAQLGLRSDNRPTVRNITIAGGYGYGGGYGEKAVICGTTYIGLHGGTVHKDIYAGCTMGGVYDYFGAGNYETKANAYIEGGSVRNVYGAGWQGRVGYTELPYTIEGTKSRSEIQAIIDKDKLGISNVVIGIREDQSEGIADYGFYKGVPTVERNAYASGEDGGAVFGTAYVTVNNGYIGYHYDRKSKEYRENLNDATWWDANAANPQPKDSLNRLNGSGNIFGGGYTDNASADNSVVTVYGGYIRNSVYGGGEVATIGRGEALESGDLNAVRQLKGIYMPGHTQVNIYSGNILRNVFGGGKGFNNLGETGSRFTNGYVFGETEVNIYGGFIGTTETVAEGDGNVFGGGNIGYVFNTFNSKKYDEDGGDGYYYLYDYNTNAYKLADGEKQLTEDCRVVVTPYAKVKRGSVTLVNAEGTSKTFNKNDYVPTEYLNRLQKNDTRWTQLDSTGITIRNAVFAGGNVSSGNELYANTKTVYGNATASLNDLYYCDLITVGTDHIGGLYGDGNLTRVDGYRELNITNYGTDYYGMNVDKVTIDEYNKMSDRERAYFEVKYLCKKAFTADGNNCKEDETLTLDEIKEKYGTSNESLNADGTPKEEYWEEYGFVSIYAGRLINTIQRADFVGVFGSRMVMEGARDRVPETVDYTDYTINRVGEISLNRSYDPNGLKDTNNVVKLHGNYFGIYNIVNHLGALTSDVDFDEVRTTKKSNDAVYTPDRTGQSFYDWKQEHRYNRKRNDGTTDNMVALASGVYLELTTENSNADNKDWGILTGIMELDLINVMPGLGGGFVYAKNMHGKRSETGLKHITLSKYNQSAVSNKKYTYADPVTDDDFETSGNLISSKTIIDDCFPKNDSYMGADAASAHYWYIKGEIYVYDQFISAYTGAADAYDKTVNIPLTITAGSHGVIQLQDVKPNKYAYYGTDGTTPIGLTEEVIINNVTYHLNDTISYWDWSQLTATDKLKFVDETYVAIADFEIDNAEGLPSGVSTGEILQGTAMLPEMYNSLKEIKVLHKAKNVHVDFTDVVRPSNDLSHAQGFALTLDLSNPQVWSRYYSPASGEVENSKVTTNNSGYLSAPTYKVSQAGIYGQREYNKGDIITEDLYTYYENTLRTKLASSTGQAEFERAYVLSEDVAITNANGTINYMNSGLVIPASEYTANQAALGSKAGLAYYCTETWKLEATGKTDEYVFYSSSMTEAQIRALATAYGYTSDQITAAINAYFSPAYYCSATGLYGGKYYEAGSNYKVLDSWATVNPEDRSKFSFNYDAFDLLTDPTFKAATTVYDGTNTNKIYSGEQHIDYNARYIGTTPLVYNNNGTVVTINKNDVLSRAQYELIPNEQYHYSPFESKSGESVYIVKTKFTKGNDSYSVGNSITASAYELLGNDEKQKIDVVSGLSGKYYYCTSEYKVGENGTVGQEGVSVTNVRNNSNNTITTGQTVSQGVVITTENYKQLPNLQSDFNINGITPIETATLYVSAQSDILNLSRGKVYTVTYVYDYDESDDSGNNINHVTEKHIVNVHVDFKAGNPTIGDINNLSAVLPGATIGVTTPRVTPGAYEVIGGGWEIYANANDAQAHVNGAEFVNGSTPLYWYNDGYYLAYYAKTYLGKTYSNAVPFKVANYHDLAAVLGDKEHHMYVDHPNVQRNSKIYINSDVFNENNTKNELDMLRDIYDLSLYTLSYDANNNPIAIANGTFAGHNPMNSHVKGAQNLEFILNSDIAPKAYTTWTSIGTATQCFEGNLHGDGHTISGLTSSLFGYLCGNVYNLGVTGSFTTSGIADNGGSAENCWIMTSSDADLSGTNAVMGNGVVTNCYYPQTNSFSAASTATARPMRSFNNGEVAYNLNGFYLTKRYAIANDASDNKYFYTITSNANNTLSDLPSDYSASDDYVTKRIVDGDFIYANGYIPDQLNERQFYVEPEEGETPDPKNNKYFPIYPDDYIFFGQNLSYGYTTQDYQQYPSSVNKADRTATADQHPAAGWLVREEATSNSNRVYRAPAYFGNSTQDIAHFNANAVLPATIKDSETKIYNGMTALDLTGYNDASWTNGWDGGIFMKRILDYNGLTSFRTDGQTRNLLVYMDNADASKTIVSDYLADQDWDYVTGTDADKAIDVLESALAAKVKGHLVNLKDGEYIAQSDHYLVDMQDFNAPIAYTFSDDNTMWYQRTPGVYVESTAAGWETVSLPFTAEFVTTQDKGEITHFYTGDNGKLGHEYWLRSYSTVDTDNNKVEFATLTAGSTSKTVANTFLYNYYYSKNDRKDANTDTYYQTYYSESRDYNDYPLYAEGKPYLIGFPGKRYYEFDLSGQFEPKNTFESIRKLGAQVITFVSKQGQVIEVTDNQYSTATEEADGYTFTPTYQAKEVSNAYMIAADGSKFSLAATATTVPFRAYMTHQTAQPAATRSAGDDLFISIPAQSEQMEQYVANRGLNVYGEHMTICIESTLDQPATVTITTVAGKLLKNVVIQPGTKITIPVNSRGVYIVNRRKVSVTR